MSVGCVRVGRHLGAFKPIGAMDISAYLLAQQFLYDESTARVQEVSDIVDLVLVHHVPDVGKFSHDLFFIDPLRKHFEQPLVFHRIVEVLSHRDVELLVLLKIPPLENSQSDQEENPSVNGDYSERNAPLVAHLNPPADVYLCPGQQVDEISCEDVDLLVKGRFHWVLVLALNSKFPKKPDYLDQDDHQKNEHSDDRVAHSDRIQF